MPTKTEIVCVNSLSGRLTFYKEHLLGVDLYLYDREGSFATSCLVILQKMRLVLNTK